MSALISHYIVVPIAAVHNLGLLFYHSYLIYISSLFTKSKYKFPTVQMLSLITLFSLSLLLIWTALFTLSLIPLDHCGWIIKFAMILFQCSKVSMYSLFLERLFSVFKNCTLTFTNTQMFLSRSLLATYLIFTVCIIYIFGDGEFMEEVNIAPCRANYPFWVNLISVLGDLLICTTLSISFSRRLILLSMTQEKQESLELSDHESMKNLFDKRGDPLLEILSKSTLLSFIALFTTEICLVLIGIIGYPAIWISVDAIINGWCVIL
eukprot:116246_1